MDARAADNSVAPGALVLAVVMGMAYFFLHELAQAYFTRARLPDVVYSFWYAQPTLGGWLIGALGALVSHWLIGLTVGLALALAVRRQFLLYGTVALGAWLMCAWMFRLDGWYSAVQFGPDFWVTMRAKALVTDPVGALSALLALPLCTAWWGRHAGTLR